MVLKIVRYSNRKLYDTVLKRYTTLQELSQGYYKDTFESFQVVQHNTNKDITLWIMAQIETQNIKQRTFNVPSNSVA